MKAIGFAHIGTKRTVQQDAILLNQKLLSEGQISIESKGQISCFVADGVASSSDGAFASNFVLNEIAKIHFSELWHENVLSIREVNLDLINRNATNGQNAATTLTGIYINGDDVQVFQAGDSEIYLIRNNRFLPLATVQNETVDNIKKKYPGISLTQAYEKAANTLTSFLGSQVNRLRFDEDWKRRIHLPAINGLQKSDKILICSDGLFKAISKTEFATLLIDLNTLPHELNNWIVKHGAPDNVSLILLEI